MFSVDLDSLVVAVIALGISIFAIVVAMVQLTQQLFATAYDYRRCSPRTVGGWAKCTRRRWVWREVRFEIEFSAPKIRINLRPAVVANNDGQQSVQQRTRQYKFYEAKLNKAKPDAVAVENDASDKPWYLSTERTLPESICSWLSLLEDTALLDDVQVVIEERKSYLDLVPKNSRPLATADRTSFLTLMCLFGIRWENKGKDRRFTGAGEFCEVSEINIPYYGSVFVYQDLHSRLLDSSRRFTDQKFLLYSEKARLAMFHCFDLGFATFRTQNDVELAESLKSRIDGQVADVVVAFYRGSNAWCPGLSESITCWADKSMPKMLDVNTNKFKSMFSAVSARSLSTGNPKFVAMLLGDGSSHPHRNGQPVDSIQRVMEWAKEYLTSFPDLQGKVYKCLVYAATWPPEYRDQNTIVDVDIPWDMSSQCLEGVNALDEHLEGNLLSLASFGTEDQRKLTLKSAISNQQIIHGSRLYEDATNAAKAHSPSWWMAEVDRVGAENYVKVVNYLNENFQTMPGTMLESRLLTQRIVVNRLMRGSLWVVHNGNAPDQVKRVSECSLSSSVLADNPTVYIS